MKNKKITFTTGTLKKELGIELIDKPKFKNGINDLKKMIGDQVLLMDFQKIKPQDSDVFYRATLVSPLYSETISGANTINLYFDTEEIFNDIENNMSGIFVSSNDLPILDYSVSSKPNFGKDEKTGKTFNYSTYQISSITLGNKK